MESVYEQTVAPDGTAAGRDKGGMPRISLRRGLWRYRTDRVGLFRDLGRQRRDIVKTSLGPLQVAIVTGAEYARAVLVEHDSAFRKGPAVSRYARPLLGDGLLSSHGAEHRRQRKVLAPKFQPRQIAGYFDVMAAHTNAMLARWQTAEPSDFAREMSDLTIGFTAQVMFGAEVADHIPIIRHALEVAQRYMITESASLLHVPLSWPTRRNRELHEAIAAVDELVYRLIRERRAAGGPRGDVLAALLEAQQENGVDDTRVRDEVITFFMAGHETTATALSWAYVLLAGAPEVAAELAREADAALAREAPWPETVARLELAGRVLRETLRMYPPLYMVSRQALRDVALGPFVLRRGSYVQINILGMHYRDDYFAEPESFAPQRFAGDATWPRTGYLPFGAGPRVCIGNHFAMMGGTLILALLARAVEFRRTWDKVELEPLITLRPLGGVPFGVHWRKLP